MHKTEKDLDKLKKTFNLFFLLLDSRAPQTSLMQNFMSDIDKKKIVIFLTKADLVERSELKKWEKYYKKIYLDCLVIEKNNQNKVRDQIDAIFKKHLSNIILPKILITGIPNVGKSTLLNIIGKKKVAKVENRPGVTNRINWYQFDKYWILDTPGILEPKFDTVEKGVILALIGSIKLDILPIEEIIIYLQEILNIDLHLENKKLSYDNLKQYIINFQNGEYGKIIIDHFEN